MATPRLKNLILTLLKENHLLSASAILATLSQQGQNFNKTSIYRALDKLELEQVLCRHHFSDDEAYYELREHHHAHLVCTQCGNVQSGDCTYVEPREIGSFKVDHHHTTLFGMCGDCQKLNQSG